MMRFGYGIGAGCGMFGGGFMMIIPILLGVLLIYVIFKGINLHNNARFSSNSVALNILDEKLANGEISEEEYNRKKKVLRG
jgi:putative membrane protein